MLRYLLLRSYGCAQLIDVDNIFGRVRQRFVAFQPDEAFPTASGAFGGNRSAAVVAKIKAEPLGTKGYFETPIVDAGDRAGTGGLGA